MEYSETRRHIDTARDILVGKVPDPKSQVEQITIALIYKFMGDMDQQSIDMGGKASFFTGEYEKYAWSSIFDPRLGGIDMLNLYSEAITKMTENANLPELFRNIFKNAFLPYRDPETLKMFLKEINFFDYDHSENLGDAFEYLLSVLGSQGDAGQFRTPRHIIDFMVKVVDPKKDETILDPACGTAGFLISAYKHIMGIENGANGNGKAKTDAGNLTISERQTLYENFTGYDISPDMVRLSLVNMYLHGFIKPKIFEYDTLTSEDRWNDYADVILANPPFMSPKGGIQPHKRFSVQSKRSEVLFVNYMAEHLTPSGRAAIIVPEGIIFQSGNAYKQLRRQLIEQNYLWAVVSLPSGVFNPYAGVKTSILFLDRDLAKKTDEILFVKIEADGFDLGAQRRPIEKNDLPQALNEMQLWQQSIQSTGVTSQREVKDTDTAYLTKTEFVVLDKSITRKLSMPVSKERLAENGDYNLSVDRYNIQSHSEISSYEMVSIKSLCDLITDGDWIESKDQSQSGIRLIQTGNVGFGEYLDKSGKSRFVTEETFSRLNCKEVLPGDLLISRLPDPVGRACIVPNLDTKMITAVDCTIIRFNKEKILPEYFLYLSKTDNYYKELSQYLTGSSRKRISRSNLENAQIPLPSLEVQQQIVDEIAGYQRIIDGARQVVENWKPNLEFEDFSKYEFKKLDVLCEIVRGSSPRPKNDKRFYGGDVPRLMVADVTRDGMYVTPNIDTLTIEGAKQSRPMKKGDLVMAVSGQPGLCSILAIDACIHDGFAGFRNIDQNKILVEFAYYYLMSQRENNSSQSVGAIFKNLNTSQLRELEIPIPPLETQQKVITEIENEKSLVDANNELIGIFEEKIKKVIDRVWEA